MQQKIMVRVSGGSSEKNGSWNVVPQYMVHHHMEITEIERLQMVSSLVHSSLVELV